MSHSVHLQRGSGRVLLLGGVWGRHTAALGGCSMPLLLKEHVLSTNSTNPHISPCTDLWELLDPPAEGQAHLFHWDVGPVLM